MNGNAETLIRDEQIESNVILFHGFILKLDVIIDNLTHED